MSNPSNYLRDLNGKEISVDGTSVLPRRNELNLIAGAGVVLAGVDNVAANRTDVTIAASSVVDWKVSVRAATSGALPANTRTGNVLTASANGALPAQDGVTLAVGDRLLVQNEATGANNGIYVVTQVGSGSLPWILTRASDADADAEVTAGMAIPVSEGSTYADTIRILTTNDPITLNTTALTFAAFGGGSAGWTDDGAVVRLTSPTDVVIVGSATLVNEQGGSISAVSTGSGTTRGLISWQHSTNTEGAALSLRKSRNTRASPQAVADGDDVGGITFYGHDGAAYQPRALLAAYIDGAVSGGVVPTALAIVTGAAAVALRTTWSSTGSQSHDTDASGTYTWTIGATLPMRYTGGALLVGHTAAAGGSTAEVAGAVSSISTSTSTPRGLLAWQHGDNASGASINGFKGRGTRESPTIVQNSDSLVAVNATGYLDGATSAYVSRGRLRFSVDAAPSGASGSLPTAAEIATGTTGLTTRSTWSSAGAQTHDTDASQTYKWRIAAAAGAMLAGSALYAGSETTLSEEAGSVVSVCTTSARRGLLAFQHSADANPAEIRLFKSRGTRSSLGAVVSPDELGYVRFYGYTGTTSTWIVRAQIAAYIDGAVTDASGTMPSGLAISTGTTSAIQRSQWSSAGSQFHNTDASGTYKWEINSAAGMYVAGQAIYAATETALSEDAGSIVSTSTGSGARRNLIAYQHSADATQALLVLAKSRGTRSSLGAVTSGDGLGHVQFQGYAGATGGWVARARIAGAVDNTVVDGATPTVPSSIAILTGTTTVASRTIWSSTGTQTHNCDSGSTYVWQVNGSTQVTINDSVGIVLASGRMVDFGQSRALGGGATATLGTIGGSGPATAGQNQWLEVKVGGNTRWIPVWA